MTLLNLVQMTVSGAPGTGNITLGSAVPKWLTFALAGATNGMVIPVVITDGNDTEHSTITYSTTGPSLTGRTLRKSTTGSLLSLTANAIVSSTAGAEDLLQSVTGSTGISAVYTGAALSVDLTDTGVSAGDYGSAVNAAGFLVDAKGRITTAFESSMRERLTGGRTYYVRSDPVTITVSTGSVTTINWTNHGRSVGDQVVFYNPRDRIACTITAANPGVVTANGHGFAGSDPIRFATTGSLPNNCKQGTNNFFVKSVSSNTFNFATSVGGSNVNTSAISTTFTNGNTNVVTGAVHNLVAGQRIRFSGSVATNFATATDYFILTVPTTTSVQLATTQTGTPIVAGSSASGGTLQQSGTHYVYRNSSFPTGLTEGTIYYVKSVTSSNAFTISATNGGADLVTSGTASGPIKAQWGNDGNDGLSTAQPFLTISQAFAKAVQLDLDGVNVAVSVADGYYNENASMTGHAIGIDRIVYTTGARNTSNPSNCMVWPTSGRSFHNSDAAHRIKCFSVKVNGDYAVTAEVHSIVYVVAPFIFRECVGSGLMFAQSGGIMRHDSDNAGVDEVAIDFCTGNNVLILADSTGSNSTWAGWVGRLTNVPAFERFAYATNGGYVGAWSHTWDGGVATTANGYRYQVFNNGIIDVQGAGVSVLPGYQAGVDDGHGIYI